MWEIFNFTDPVMGVINILIVIAILSTAFFLYKIASLYEFYDEARRFNQKAENISESFDKDPDFEPFFGGFSTKKSFSSFTEEEYMNTVFDEFAKHFSESKKENVDNSSKVIQSKVESFPESYKILGFKSKPKSQKEIKDRYRELAKKLHPDSGGSQELFIKVNEAYKESLEIWKKDNSRL